MCLSTPKIPPMPAMPPTPPPPAPAPIPEEPTPPPSLVNATGTEAPKLRRTRSKRQEVQQSSQGTGALRIPLNTPAPSGLNIPR